VGSFPPPYHHLHSQIAHRARLRALHRLVLGGVAPTGLLPAVRVQALLPVVGLSPWAQINFEVVHPEFTGDRIAPAGPVAGASGSAATLVHTAGRPKGPRRAWGWRRAKLLKASRGPDSPTLPGMSLAPAHLSRRVVRPPHAGPARSLSDMMGTVAAPGPPLPPLPAAGPGAAPTSAMAPVLAPL
jgi:hypothetical protein